MAAFEKPITHPVDVRDELQPAGGLARSDRFARLRAELAEAVASAELARVRKDCEFARKESEMWRAVADERDRALERADFALQSLAKMIATADARSSESASMGQEIAAASRELARATQELSAASRAVSAAREVTVTRAFEISHTGPAIAPPPAPPPPPPVAPAPMATLIVPPEVEKPPPPAPAFVAEEPRPMPHVDDEGNEVIEPDDVVPIPSHVREEAERYAQTMHAMSEYKLDLARPRHWWQFWR